MKEDILQIIEHYGVSKQLKYIHSEYFELDEAIIECENSGNNPDYYKENIAGEIADIMVMLKQFQYHYEIEDSEIESIMKFKIDRQLKRIELERENEENENE